MHSLKDYAASHRHWGNIVIHILSAPFFMAGTLIGILGLLSGDLSRALASLVVVVMALALQRIGHQLESVSPPPFTGIADFTRRVFAEQFYRFWLFLVMKWQGIL